MLACGSSDGSISIISSTGKNEFLINLEKENLYLGDGRWTTKKIPDCHPVSEFDSL
jgi:hypothetical protein